MTATKPRLGQKATIRHRCTGTTARATWNGVGWHCQCGDVVFGAEVVGRGRPAIGKPLTVRVDADTRARLEKRAVADGVPVAEVARRILDTHA